jgi:signal transduction histidine kinase
MNKMRKISSPFKPRARLLLALGNQLIKDEGIALFELVKNSYDADATSATASLENIDNPGNGKIVIRDDGTGMDWETITKVWLEPGTDYREKQVRGGQRTKKYRRMPLGQKGIGRFGAHKLGEKIRLVTRSNNNNEIVVNVDWSDFEKKEYLQEVEVSIYEREPKLFIGKSTGTQITITNLSTVWNRGMVRNVSRAINSICSPFKSPDSFKAVLEIQDKDKKDWLEGILTWREAVASKLFRATINLDGSKLSYEYKFVPWETMTKVSGRKMDLIKEKKTISMVDEDTKQIIDLDDFNIGKVKMDLYIFDLDTNILSLGVTDKRGLKEFLKFNGGIRVYRDGVRVYDYGEPGNDWLDLGGRRVNVPSAKLSNNLIIGAASLNRVDSTDLQEKTNREGFIENEAVQTFRKAILYALSQIEAERNKDKERLRIAYSKTTKREPVLDALSELRNKIEKKGLITELGEYLDRVEADYKDIREKLLTSAGAGLSLSIVIHEIEKIIKELKLAVEKEKGEPHIKRLTKHLAELIEGYAILVKRGGIVKIKASEMIDQAKFNVDYRLNSHNIRLIDGCTKQNDFTIKCSKRLILGAIMNILDNSIWWLEVRKPPKKTIFITTTTELAEGPAIVIGDNGPGFMDDLEYLTQPFFTRKPDGMGLGLHITNEIMKVHKGNLKILEKGDIRLPKEIDGAAIALIFKEE